MPNVIVTGGSRGLGLGIARTLRSAGHTVVAVARRESEALTAAMNGPAPSGEGAIHFVSFDLAVAPGFINTEMTGELGEQAREKIARRSALRRMADVDDVASAVEFLFSDKAKNITGTTLTVDAGNTA
jgi:NAD(P)-dependent dehydrogenase (short-subunit alcohol dehydrogenase family)